MVTVKYPPGIVKHTAHIVQAMRGLFRSRAGTIGMIIVLTHITIALFAPMIIPYDYSQQSAAARFQAPSAEHRLGTDQLGRDVLSRTLMGGRVALMVTVISSLVAIAWGGLIGILLGLIGGHIDELIMRSVDALLAIPWVLFLLIIVSLMGRDNGVLIITLSFFYGLPAIRIVRAATLDFVAQDFITAARVRGERPLTIVLRELLPNVLDVLLVEGAMEWSWMLLGFSSLSFLGFGVTAPTPDWGLMISDNRTNLAIAPWATIYPTLALSSLIIGVNLVADAMAKALGLDRTQGAPI